MGYLDPDFNYCDELGNENFIPIGEALEWIIKRQTVIVGCERWGVRDLTVD